MSGGPRGIYVTSRLGGFYYRQRLGGGLAPRASVLPRPAPEIAGAQIYATRAVGSASVDDLTDLSQDEFVSSLNEWTKRGVLPIASLMMAAVILVVAGAAGAAAPLLMELAVYGAIGFLLARFIANRKRRLLLMFDLVPADAARFQRLHASLGELAASGRFRGVSLIGHHADWKRNAGATRSLSFEAAALRHAAPPHITTNLIPWMLSTQGMQLYFFPDRVLIWSRGRFAALSYESLELSTDTSNFVWDESLPDDAHIVGETWLYVRRDGGPDGRFNNNRPIPIVRTAYVTLKSPTGLEVVVQATRIAAAEKFTREVRSYAGIAAVRSALAIVSAISPEVGVALAALGLGHLPSLADLKQTYHQLVSRNHPDKFGGAARDIRLFAEQRMKEINAAYRLVLGYVEKGLATGEASGGALIEHLRPATPAGNWRSAERLATIGALFAAVFVFAIGRSMSAERQHAVPAQSAVTREAPEVVRAPPAALTRRLVITCPLRIEPSPRARQIGVIPKRTEVALLDEYAGWRRVRDDSGNEGWTGPKCWQPAALSTGRPARPKKPLPAAGTAVDTGTEQVTPSGIENAVPVDPYAGPAEPASATSRAPAVRAPELVDPISPGSDAALGP